MKSLKFRLLITIVGVLAATGGARAQAKFPPDSDNAALRYWTALTEMSNTIDGDETTRNLLSATITGEIPWDENKLGPILDENAGAVQAMQRGAKLPECTWGLDYHLGVITPVQMVMRARGLERLWARRSRYPGVGSERHAGGHFPGHYSASETRQIATGAEEGFVQGYPTVA